MKRDRAEYMRIWRARKAGCDRFGDKPVTEPNGIAKGPMHLTSTTGHAACDQRIADFEAEVQRLKRALAQANRDAILRAVNRK